MPSPPYATNNPAIAPLMLSRTGRGVRVLHWGDSIGTGLDGTWYRYWPGPIAGCGVMGGDCNSFFSSNADVTLGTACMLQGSTLLGGSNNYSPFTAREAVFTGTTWGPLDNPSQSNRFIEGSDLGSRWATIKPLEIFANDDWTYLAPDLQLQALFYRNSASANTTNGYARNSVDAKAADFGNLHLQTGTPGHTLYTAPFTSVLPDDGWAFDLQALAGPSVNGSNVVLSHAIIWSPSKVGLTLIPAAIGGWTAGLYCLDSVVTQAAMSDAYGTLAIDVVMIDLTTNGPLCDSGGNPVLPGTPGAHFATPSEYQAIATTMRDRCRTALPYAAILFIGMYDSGAGSYYTDPLYQVYLTTPNAAFINLTTQLPPYAVLLNAGLVTGVHPVNDGLRAMVIEGVYSTLETMATYPVAGGGMIGGFIS